jgi:hypothetical protein
VVFFGSICPGKRLFLILDLKNIPGFTFFEDFEVLGLTKYVLSFIKNFSEKINFFIPRTFYVISREKLSTILLDPNLKQYLINQARLIGYSQDFLDEFFKSTKDSSKTRFNNCKYFINQINSKLMF